MTELTDLLVDLSPTLRVGWILWLSTGLALGAWFLARMNPLPVASSTPSRLTVQPLPARQFVPLALQKEPLNAGGPPPVAAPTLSAASQPSQEDLDRPARKSRRSRRNA